VPAKEKAVVKNPAAQAMVAMRNKNLSAARRKELVQKAPREKILSVGAPN
jgi:hypothetical protein